MKTGTLNLVPVEYAEELSEQLSAALQIIAALLPLSDEEVILIQSARDPLEDNGKYAKWAESMKQDLLSHRSELVKILTRHGFPTNTHSGFCFGPLSASAPHPYLVAEATNALCQVLELCESGQMVLSYPLDGEQAKQKVREITSASPFSDSLEQGIAAAIDWLFTPQGIGTLQINLAMMRQLTKGSTQ